MSAAGPVVAVIPARYASQRFPGKMLASDTGRPLIQHVYEQTAKSAVDRVLVAADDDRIADAVRGFGGEVVMTRVDHPNGTSRIAEAVADIDAPIIVNVQGDEPEIDPAVIDAAVAALRAHDDCVVSTVASPFQPGEDPANPNIVKVALDQVGRALYFSRALIPHDRDGDGHITPLKHVGLYVYRREFLLRYPDLVPTPLEASEKLEQLRILEHGERIAVATMPTAHHGIDTPEQYAAFVARWNAD